MTPERRRAVSILVLALIVGFVGWRLYRSHFAWGAFWRACRSVDWRLLLLGTLVLWTNFLFRAARWAVFLKPALPPGGRVYWVGLVRPQFVGFAGIAALGRFGELIRPYLVSQRTGLPLSSQVAVVAVERVFDLGAFGILFTGNLLLSTQLNTLPYSNRFHLFGFAIAGLMAVVALVLLLVAYTGERVARLTGVVADRFSSTTGAAAAARVLEFRHGLRTIGSPADFLRVAALSLLTWLSIAGSYVLVLRAFPAPVQGMTVAEAILLMGCSVAGSVVQLPGIGGGAQVLVISALTVLFAVPKELATSAGLILWAITSMSVILPGLLFARAEQLSLRGIARQSGAAHVEAKPQPVH